MQVPSDEVLEGILALTLAYIDANDRAKESPSAETFQVRSAVRAELRRRYTAARAAVVIGRPERTVRVLRTIGLLCGPQLYPPMPDQFPGLRGEIEQLSPEGSKGPEIDPAASRRLEKVPSVRAVERACLDGVHDDVEKTAESLQELGLIGEWEIRQDGRGRRWLWVVWLKKPEGLGRRTRQKKRPRS
jgi:hypothetical protein